MVRGGGPEHRARSLAPARSLARCPTSSGAAARSSGLARSLPLARSPGAQLLPGRRPRNFRGVAPEHKNLPRPCGNSSGMDTPEEFPRCVLFFLSRLRSAPDVRDRAPESRCAVEIHKLPRKGEAPPSGVSPRSHETPEKVLGIPLLKAVFWPGTQNAQRTLKNAPHVDLRPPLERPVSRFSALGNGFGNW